MTSGVGTACIEVIRRELACPMCGYSLNGLHGDVITCPECGAGCDITAMVAARWRGSWRAAPGYSRMLWPVAWLGITCWFILLTYVYEVEAPPSPGSGVITALTSAAILAVWCALLVRTSRQFTQGRGLLLLALSHLILAAYFAGLIVALAGLIAAARGGAAWLFVGAVGGAVIYVCYLGEKYMARMCIREHLLTAATKLRSAR